MPRALQALTSAQWAIVPENLEIMRAICSRENIQALTSKDAPLLKNTRKPVEIHGSVAVMFITGPIFRYANLFTDFCGATATGELTKDLETLAENPKVKSIVPVFNTPGGEVTSLSESAEMLGKIEARTGKKVIAYVDGMAASAGYWLASECSEIVVSKTAILGSIGAVVGYRKPKPESDEEYGEMVSSRSKNKRPDMSTEEGRDIVQTMLDDLADVFIAQASAGRGMTEDALLEACNHGATVVGQKAVDAGLADRVGNLPDLIAELNANPGLTTSPKPKAKTTQAKTTTTPKGSNMPAYATLAEMQAENKDLCATLEAQAVATAKPELEKTALAQGVEQGKKAEQTRVAAILSAPVLGHENLRTVALQTEGQTVAELQGAVLAAEDKKRTDFVAGAGNNADEIEADADAETTDKVDAQALTATARSYMATPEGKNTPFANALRMAQKGEI